MIKVVVHGALGRMGQAVVNAVCGAPELQLAGAVDIKADRDTLQVPDGAGEIPLFANIGTFLENFTPDVMVDFTQHDVVMPAIRTATENKVNVVIGTTGMSDDDFDEIDRLSRQHDVGAVVAPNFSLGAVLMMYLSRIAARFFDYAEIVEMHHEKKLDSPSGTAVTTAKEMARAREADFIHPESQKENLPGGRGADLSGIAIHSVRSPGFVASQEVILGTLGQTLRIRHDQINREGYGPGIVLAVKEVVKLKGLVVGLDKLMGL